MNRRSFLTSALALAAVIPLLSKVSLSEGIEPYSFPLKESSLSELLTKLTKQSNQRIGVIVDSTKVRAFTKEFLIKDKLSNTVYNRVEE